MHEGLIHLLQLLGTATAVAVVARRLRMPYTTALVLAALAMGSMHLLPAMKLDAEVVIRVFLPILLFEAAINTDATHLRENLTPVTLLATVGMAFMIAVTGAVLHLALGLSWSVALLLGCMLSITDTVAVLAVFKDMTVPTRLATIMEGESLLNDGTALVAFRVLQTAVATGVLAPVHAGLEMVWVVAGGLAVGGVLGMIVSLALAQTRDHLTEIMLTTLLALGAFFLAERLGVSGVIAVVIAGLVVGNYGWRRALAPSSQIALGSFWEYAGFGVNSAVFLLVGLNLNHLGLLTYVPAIAIAFLAVQIGRASTVYPLFLFLNRRNQEPVPLRWQHLIFWGNLKGSLTMALALSLPDDMPGRDAMVAIAFGVVLLSLVVQGLSLGPLVRWLGIAERSNLRRLFEREQVRIVAARAAQQELSALHEAGILSKSTYERLRARYQVTIANSERELRRLGTDFQAHWDVVLEETRQRLRLVEKGAVRNALRRGLVSPEAASEYLAELDMLLVEPGPEA
ncbi:MAG: NhaP-type Na+(K+)/H+ antiporter [Cyanobacteria bacterium RYN_339]|nr:NhaP-type Na+(K+)/H+ antiporter [Cyanobacteria bacterium RYN_339]